MLLLAHNLDVVVRSGLPNLFSFVLVGYTTFYQCLPFLQRSHNCHRMNSFKIVKNPEDSLVKRR